MLPVDHIGDGAQRALSSGRVKTADGLTHKDLLDLEALRVQVLKEVEAQIQREMEKPSASDIDYNQYGASTFDFNVFQYKILISEPLVLFFYIDLFAGFEKQAKNQYKNQYFSNVSTCLPFPFWTPDIAAPAPSFGGLYVQISRQSVILCH